MGDIVLLDELTINQIAAGEVIERPASVIKEMVENSIDAGATIITVEIRNGGISYIKVTDNGKGIASDDLEIAFERHATSKIRSAKDLDTVTSMGFRGEALASIAAISKVEMVSKTEEQEIGYKIVVEAGNVLNKEEIGCQTGTSITVENLFFNTPVRYKFLKKDYTESGYIEDAITRIALVHPEVSIKLINTGKTVMQTNGNGDLKGVIYSIYGKDIAKSVIDVSYEYEDIKVTGVIGKPEISRANRTNQLFFVNKRYIKDKTLTAATEAAYKGLMQAGKFAYVVLNLEMNPAKVDVNVHPAKLEVRFEEEQKVFQSVYHAIKDTFAKNDLSKTKLEDKSLNNRELSFEERLRKLQESKEYKNALKSSRFNNLKKETKNIDTIQEKMERQPIVEPKRINDTENSNNNIIEELYKNRNKEDKNIEDKKSIGKVENENTTEKKELKNENNNMIDSSDILAKLKSLKESMENEIKEKAEDVAIQKLNEESTKYELEVKKEESLLDETEEKDIDSIKDINMTTTLEEKSEENEEKREEKKENKFDLSSNVHIINEIKDDPEIKKEFEGIKQKINKLNDNPQVVSENFEEMYSKLFGKKPVDEKNKNEEDEEKFSALDIIKDNISVFENIQEEINKPIYKLIGVTFDKYAIIEMNNEMYIINIGLAKEKIVYENIRKTFKEKTKNNSQMLLLPDVITLTPRQMDISNDNKKYLAQLGFSVEDFGENTIKLTGVPEICMDLDTKELYVEILKEINKVARTDLEKKEEKIIEILAKKMANKNIEDEEITGLMDEFLILKDAFKFEDGRNVAIKMSKYDIERKFARK